MIPTTTLPIQKAVSFSELRNRLSSGASTPFMLAVIKAVKASIKTHNLSIEQVMTCNGQLTVYQLAIIGMLSSIFKSVPADAYKNIFVTADGKVPLKGPDVQEIILQLKHEETLFLGNASKEDRIRIEAYRKIYTETLRGYQNIIE